MVLKEGMSESQKMNSYGAFFKKDKVARIQEVAAITTGWKFATIGNSQTISLEIWTAKPNKNEMV